MEVEHVSSEGQIADIMTKPLETTAFRRLRGELGMVEGNSKVEL